MGPCCRVLDWYGACCRVLHQRQRKRVKGIARDGLSMWVPNVRCFATRQSLPIAVWKDPTGKQHPSITNWMLTFVCTHTRTHAHTRASQRLHMHAHAPHNVYTCTHAHTRASQRLHTHARTRASQRLHTHEQMRTQPKGCTCLVVLGLGKKARAQFIVTSPMTSSSSKRSSSYVSSMSHGLKAVS